MPHYPLFYDVADDDLARRGDVRAAHLAKAWVAGADAVSPVRP